MTLDTYLKEIKDHMRTNKMDWFNRCELVDGHVVSLKFYGKSIQSLKVDGLSHGGLYDIPTQREFLAYVAQAINDSDTAPEFYIENKEV